MGTLFDGYSLYNRLKMLSLFMEAIVKNHNRFLCRNFTLEKNFFVNGLFISMQALQ